MKVTAASKRRCSVNVEAYLRVCARARRLMRRFLGVQVLQIIAVGRWDDGDDVVVHWFWLGDRSMM